MPRRLRCGDGRQLTQGICDELRAPLAAMGFELVEQICDGQPRQQCRINIHSPEVFRAYRL